MIVVDNYDLDLLLTQGVVGIRFLSDERNVATLLIQLKEVAGERQLGFSVSTRPLNFSDVNDAGNAYKALFDAISVELAEIDKRVKEVFKGGVEQQ